MPQNSLDPEARAWAIRVAREYIASEIGEQGSGNLRFMPQGEWERFAIALLGHDVPEWLMRPVLENEPSSWAELTAERAQLSADAA
jgi:hypothetical protein